jgi:GT2 family glycosyltransferase
VRIAVIVCTRDRPAWLARALASLAGQVREGRVLVVDQSADDAGRAIAERAGATWLRAPPNGLPAARNRGLAEAAAGGEEVCLFLDDDVHVLPGCVAAHLRAYAARPELGGAVGRIRERVARPNAASVQNRLDLAGRVRTHLDGWWHGDVATLKGAQMSFRTEALLGVGGFDEAMGGTAFLEDAEASLRVARAGWRLQFLPDAVVVHHSAPDGGCRVDDPEGWRFHNTAYVVGRHRPWAGPWSAAVFAGVAALRAIEAREPARAARLMGRWREGWRRAMQAGGGRP